MFCPKCQKEIEGDSLFCGKCGTRLIVQPITPGGSSLNIGDAAAIGGNLSLKDSHDVQNINKSVHNTSNVSNVTNNVTNVIASKNPAEILQDKKNQYMAACKRAYEDNILEPHEKAELDNLRMELGIDEQTADRILETVYQLTLCNSQRTELTSLAKIKLKQLTEALQKNEISALMRQIDTFESLAGKFSNGELQYKYYLVLAALKPQKCIEKYEQSKVDNYWKSFWTYFAYLKMGHADKASEILFSLEDKFQNYPTDNNTLLGAAGAYIQNGKDAAADYLVAVEGSFSPALQRFSDSIYLLVDPDTAREMGATEQGCAFYLINFFNKDKNPKVEVGVEHNHIQQTNNNQQSYHKKQQEDPPDALIMRVWNRMAFDAYGLIDDAREMEDFYSVIDLLMPGAVGRCPLSMVYLIAVLAQFDNTKAIAAQWAEQLMQLDPLNADADVMFAKGAIYGEGICNYPKNIDYALAFYKAAADMGNMEAACAIAEMYYKGEDVPQNYYVALQWAKMAYDAKIPSGLFFYGRAYYEGAGLPKDRLTGKKLLNMAAAMTDVQSFGIVDAKKYISENFG